MHHPSRNDRRTPVTRPRPGAARLIALAAAGAAALTGCGAPGSGGSGGSAGAAEGYPVTVEECGREVTVDAPPRRAVALNQHATEVMLALGLEDRMVGTAYLDDAVLPEYEAAYQDIPVLADEYPSFEELLAAEPDFVYAGYPGSAFDEAEGRGRDALEGAGMATYGSLEQCADEVTAETVYQEIRNVGALFGAEERAEELVGGIEDRLAGVEGRLEGTDPVDVLVVDSVGSTVFTSGGAGIGDEIIERAGGRNVFTDVDEVFADVSIEDASDRAPETILFYDYGSVPVEEKIAAVEDDPLLSRTPAVEEERYAVLPLSSAVAGVRVGDAVADVADQLHPGADG
ncbi:ABC transporter substrate-binding protein [Nocardiopsis sp. RSe5-2]|uniref:ABC transporter substrate-binding protein n=1 Tax=Nocardiopsis endophytica TaxID=3018445 RepID=A0ABT4U8S3_9ACTN|nr:ABC transporter substrate-binding protein [Nocardiopsis endophytica]MDA2813344.1 ABC transporter substrate-binding protein [Nocardiopsis endophytica]